MATNTPAGLADMKARDGSRGLVIPDAPSGWVVQKVWTCIDAKPTTSVVGFQVLCLALHAYHGL